MVDYSTAELAAADEAFDVLRRIEDVVGEHAVDDLRGDVNRARADLDRRDYDALSEICDQLDSVVFRVRQLHDALERRQA